MATSVYLGGEHFEHRLAALDAALERCRADAKTSRVKPTEEVVDRLEAKYAHGRGAGEPRARGPVRVLFRVMRIFCRIPDLALLTAALAHEARY